MPLMHRKMHASINVREIDFESLPKDFKCVVVGDNLTPACLGP